MTLGAGTARLLLVPILLAYGYIAVGYARGTPRWNNPDEPAHVNVIRQVALTGTLPVLVEGDWDQPLLDRLRSDWFPNDYEVDGIRYESHQPPLYYLLAAPVHRLTTWMPLNRQILVLRLFSIVIGAVTIVAAFVVAREAAPARPVLAVLTAATVAFVPMNTAISAAVNNDALASALAAVTLGALTVGRRRGFSDRWAVGLGVLLGALVLTKLTVYVFVPLILVTLLVAGWISRPSRSSPSSEPPTPPGPLPLARERGGKDGGSRFDSLAAERESERRLSGDLHRLLAALRWPAIAAFVGLLVCGWWLARNVALYGLLDPLAMARHDQIVVGQPRWTAYDIESLDFFFRILFRSFWGMFGWMGVVLDDGFYILYLVLTVLGIVGVEIGWLARSARPLTARSPSPTLSSPPPPPLSAPERGLGGEVSSRSGGEGHLRHAGLLTWAALLVFGEVAYYNLTFIQPQGRYLFPALVPIALFLSSGWLQLADRATSPAVVRLLTIGILAGAIAWGLGEAHGALRAAELWSDNALIVAAGIGALVVMVAPRAVRNRFPDGLGLTLALTLGLLDLAALVKFVAPAFPVR